MLSVRTILAFTTGTTCAIIQASSATDSAGRNRGHYDKDMSCEQYEEQELVPELETDRSTTKSGPDLCPTVWMPDMRQFSKDSSAPMLVPFWLRAHA